MKFFAAPVIWLCLILALPLPAATIHVPADHPTIQAGIDAAVNGDTVLVADGVWTGYGNKELDFGGRAITVASEFGPTGCIIDCEGMGRGFTFTGGEGPDSLIQGFTISNGNRFTGGGIRCSASSPTITGCVITDCVANGGGGGAIHCADGAAPSIAGNTMSNNQADGGLGGAIFVENASPVIEGNTITLNVAGDDGGAIHCIGSTVLISNNILDNNTALAEGDQAAGGGAISAREKCDITIEDNDINGNNGRAYGGGILVDDSTALIRENTISENQTDFRGAGIYLNESPSQIIGNVITDNALVAIDPWTAEGGGVFVRYGSGTVVTGNTISGNSSVDNGGGLVLYNSQDGVITGNRLENNSAAGHGGGVFLYYTYDTIASDNLLVNNQAGEYGGGLYTNSTLPLTGMTIGGNTAGISGGGLVLPSSGPSSITNSIVWGNTPDQIHGNPNSVTYSDVEGGYAGEGNIHADPLFAAGPDSINYLSQLAAGQPADSPCVDSGDPANPPPPGTTRTDGVLDSGITDMGFHFPALKTVDASFTCTPDSGTLPFTSQFTVTLYNRYGGQARRVAGRIDVETADARIITGWRSGYSNIEANGQHTAFWNQFLPGIQSLAGDNVFRVVAEDVTPAPYNQPPYPASGDTAGAGCLISGTIPRENQR